MSGFAGKARMLCSQFVELFNTKTGKRQHLALLEEISRSGAALSVRCPMRRGTQVEIDCGTCTLRGTVEECNRWPNGYFVEVAFAAGDTWSADKFRPDRLFNPNSMVCANPECGPNCARPECTP